MVTPFASRFQTFESGLKRFTMNDSLNYRQPTSCIAYFSFALLRRICMHTISSANFSQYKLTVTDVHSFDFVFIPSRK